MSITNKSLKKREAIVLKISDMLDDIYYTGLDVEDALVKIKYNLELDPLFKSNQQDIEDIMSFLKATLYKIFEVK